MKKIFLAFIVILLISVCMITASADVPPMPPTPWQRDLGDGLVFHYRPRYEHYSEGSFMWGTPTEFEAEGYPETGLYRNGELVYKVEERLKGMLYFSKDAMTFLEIGWWVPASDNPGILARFISIGPAVRFFSHGNLVHSYDVSDLVMNQRKLVFSVSHVQWDYQNKRVYDRENNTLQVETRDGHIIIFDLTTGRILSSSHSFIQRMQMHIGNAPLIWLLVLALVVFIVIMLIRFAVKRLCDK